MTKITLPNSKRSLEREISRIPDHAPNVVFFIESKKSKSNWKFKKIELIIKQDFSRTLKERQ